MSTATHNVGRYSRVCPLTNEKGLALLPEEEMLMEPLPGSIVLTSGLWGTAWQRHFDDGKWHRSGLGSPKTWTHLLKQRNLVLVYDAEEREARR